MKYLTHITAAVCTTTTNTYQSIRTGFTKIFKKMPEWSLKFNNGKYSPYGTSSFKASHCLGPLLQCWPTYRLIQDEKAYQQKVKIHYKVPHLQMSGLQSIKITAHAPLLFLLNPPSHTSTLCLACLTESWLDNQPQDLKTRVT